MKKTSRIIGHVGVDSGQIVICDPCYLDKEWDREDEYERDQVFDVSWKGEHVVIDMGRLLKEGKNFNSPISDYLERLSMNQLIEKGLAKERPVRETKVFGYNGCCRATEGPHQGGQLNYRMGHEGAGVACRSGYGDGLYPVVAHYNKEGRVSRVEILFE